VSALLDLIAEREQLEAEAAPLREKLARRDEVLAARDRAKALHERLFEQHDRAAGDAILYRRALPARPSELDAAKDAWDRAEEAVRAVELACEGTEEELQSKNTGLGIKVQQIREQVCRDVPQACALLCEAAEGERRSFQAAMARLRSVADYMGGLAVTNANGRLPEQTPEYVAEIAVRGLMGSLWDGLRLNEVTDLKTGKALHESVSAGTAQLGDITRWLPRSQVQPSAEPRVNIALDTVPSPQPDQGFVPWAGGVIRDGVLVQPEERAQDTPSGWSPTFMPAPRSG
jgi:hypothetical protein